MDMVEAIVLHQFVEKGQTWLFGRSNNVYQLYRGAYMPSFKNHNIAVPPDLLKMQLRAKRPIGSFTTSKSKLSGFQTSESEDVVIGGPMNLGLMPPL